MTNPETTDLIGLAHVPRELTTLADDGQSIPSYRGMYLMITDGKVPATLIEYIRGRYYVRRSNLPAFAQALGLQLKQPAPTRPACSRASSSAASAA
jgi:hypothetical protein